MLRTSWTPGWVCFPWLGCGFAGTSPGAAGTLALVLWQVKATHSYGGGARGTRREEDASPKTPSSVRPIRSITSFERGRAERRKGKGALNSKAGKAELPSLKNFKHPMGSPTPG